jgi:amino acid transporter
MSALRDAIDRSFSAGEHPDPVVSPHRPLGRRQLSGLGLLGQAVSTTAPVASMVVLLSLLHRVSDPVTGLLVTAAVAVGMWLVAACLSQLSARIAASGGLYSWVAIALGPRAAGAVAAGLLLKFGGSASMSLMHLSLAVSAIVVAVGGQPLGSPALVAAVGLTATAVAVVVVSGVRQAGWVLLVVEGCSLLFLLGCLLVPGTTATVTPWPPVEGNELQRIMLLSVFALAGFESAAFFGPEARRGLITTTRVIRWTPVVCGSLVMIAGLAAVLGRGGTVVDAYLFGAAGSAPTGLVVALHLALACSWLGTITGSANGVSRLVYTLGLEGVLPRRLGAVDPALRTPVRAAAAVCAVLAVTGAVLVLLGRGSALAGAMSTATRVALLLAYALGVLAMAVLLTRLGELTATTAVIAAVAGSGLLAMLAVVVVGQLRHGSVLGAALLAALLVAGPVWFWMLRLWRPQRRLRLGVVDRAESDDALPGAVAVRRTAQGELELTGRTDGTSEPHRAGR